MSKNNPRPIDVAMNEIRVLKSVIVDLRKEIISLNKQLEPLSLDLRDRKQKELDEEKSYEKVKTTWW
jgi:hypothetical protein